MRPVSAQFLAALRGSHRMLARARVCTTFQSGVNPDGIEIPIESGDVRLDSTADIRSTVDLTTDGTGMWPSTVDALLAPYGNELFVERGIDFGNGTREWVSLGYHRIVTPEQDQVPDGPIRIAASDRMWWIVKGRLTEPRQYQPTDTFGDVVDDLVLDVLPGATIEWDDATDAQTLGRTVVIEQDRYAGLNDLVTSVGKIWYWDYRGVLVIRDPPSTSVPVFVVNHGHLGMLVQMSRELSAEGVYNGLVASGEAADTQAPVHALAVDNNPLSATFWGGPFGKIPEFYSSPFITTVAQAQSAASAILRQRLGLPYNVTFGMVPNAALEPLDAIQVRYSDRNGPELHVIKDLVVPLAPGAAMTGSTREQTLVQIGVS